MTIFWGLIQPEHFSGPGQFGCHPGLTYFQDPGSGGGGGGGGGGGTSSPPVKAADPVPAKNDSRKENARKQCVNGLLLQATLRGFASFVGLPPSDPSFGDLATLVKDTVDSPAFKVAAVYTATNLARRFATKQVASRFAAKVGSSFIPGVGEAAGAIIVGQAIWDGFSWYKDQIEGDACEIP